MRLRAHLAARARNLGAELVHHRGVLARVDGRVQPRAMARVRVRLERHRLQRVVGRDVLKYLGLQAGVGGAAGSRRWRRRQR